MKKWIALAVTLALAVIIFCLSAQPGAQSGALSEQVAQQMQSSGTADVLIPAWFSANAYANVRKWAHVYIYLLLGASMAATVHSWNIGRTLPRQGAWAVVFCTLYAVTDEIHQFFVPGRAMLASDVGVDALGFVPGAALLLLTVFLWRRRALHRNSRSGPDRAGD